MEEHSGPKPGQEEEVMKDRTERVRGEGKQIADDARELAADVNELVEEATDFLRDQAIRRPYVTLASAFGLGYVIGGGVPPWAMRALFTVGSKVIVSTIISELGRTSSPGEMDPGTSG